MTHRLARPLAVLAVLGAIALTPATPALAGGDGIPFTDPEATGRLTLCDAEGHMLTHGSLDDAPFADVVVSDTHAPKGYDHNHAAKATLFAYTPVENVDPGDWISFQITASSYFSNDAHPMAEVTTLDYTLRDYVHSYPHRWDDLVQLRFAIGAARQPLILTPYPAAVLKIEGNSWRVVQGGPDDCATGKAISTEKIALKQKFASPLPVGTTVQPTDSPKPRARRASGTSAGPASGGTTGVTPAASSRSDGAGAGWLWALLAVGAAAVVGSAALLLRGRRTAVARS